MQTFSSSFFSILNFKKPHYFPSFILVPEWFDRSFKPGHCRKGPSKFQPSSVLCADRYLNEAVGARVVRSAVAFRWPCHNNDSYLACWQNEICFTIGKFGWGSQWFIYNFGLMGPGTCCFPYQWVQLQTYEARTLFLMTSLQYYCILGLTEIKTLHPWDNIMRKRYRTQVTK